MKRLKNKFKKDILQDVLLITSFFIVFFTTLNINKYIAFYLLAAFLIIFSIALKE